MKTLFDIVLLSESSDKGNTLVPLIPRHAREIQRSFPVRVVVKPSSRRLYSDEQYHREGVAVSDRWTSPSWMIVDDPADSGEISAGNCYFVTSPDSLDAWNHRADYGRRMQDLGCSLIDVEGLIGDAGDLSPSRRRPAGMVGMADSLYVLGQKWKMGGIDSPLGELKSPLEYGSSAEMMKQLDLAGERISEDGLPEQACPLIITVLGGEGFMEGIDAVLGQFPHKTFPAKVVEENIESFSGDRYSLYKVVVSEDALRGSADYPTLSLSAIWVSASNAAFGRRRLMTREQSRTESYLNPNPYPRVVGDLRGGGDGLIELLDHIPSGKGYYHTYLGREDCFVEGVAGSGTTLVNGTRWNDSFAAEMSEEYSRRFSRLLMKLIRARIEGQDRSGWAPDWLRRASRMDRGSWALEPDGASGERP